MTTTGHSAATFLCLALLVMGSTVTAQEEPAQETSRPDLPRMVRLVVPACRVDPIDVPRLMEILDIELGQSGVSLGTGEPTPPEQTALVIVDVPTCQGELVDLRVEHLGTRRSTHRELELIDTPQPERARVVALAIAELVRAAWAELAVEEPEEVTEEEPPPPPRDHVTGDELDAVRNALSRRIEAIEQARRDDEQPRAPIALDGAAGVRLFPSYGGTFLGGRIASSIRLSRRLPLQLVVDADFRFARSENELGIGRSSLLTAWGTLLATAGTRVVELGVGLGIGLGWVWSRGEAIDDSVIATNANNGVVALAVRGQLDFQVNDRLSLLVLLEAGSVLVGLTPLAADEPIVGVAGPLITIDVGLSISL